MKSRLLLLVALLTLVIAGCGPAQPEESQDTPPQEPKQNPMQELTPQINPLPQPTSNNTPDYSTAPVEKFIDLARNDLGKNLAIVPDQIIVLDTKEVIWPNAALGCPAPGKSYPQGTVPGYQIHLEVNSQQYVYHTDLNGKIILCALPNLEDPSSSNNTSDPNIGVPIQ